MLSWAEMDRKTLTEILPTALVVVPMGAVEQHGDHLPTGTDFLIASCLARHAAERTAPSIETDIVLVPELAIGASDHHLPFGGTLSLLPQTLLAVLSDMLSSMAAAGATRVVLLNGHGGNSGICHAAAAAASAHLGIAVAHIDYWRTLPVQTEAAGAPIPGHAGAFETSMILANYPVLARDRPHRDALPMITSRRGVEVHSAAQWADMDGFTDLPGSGSIELGTILTESLVDALSSAFSELAVTK